jgi:hypothetical protein
MVGAPSRRLREEAMVFMIELDGETVACSSARCVQSLLRQGWRLADPAQADDLVQVLAREEVLTPIDGPRARSH